MHQNGDKAEETRCKRLISRGLASPLQLWPDAHDDDDDDDDVDFFRNRRKEIYNISLITTRGVPDKR